MTSIFDAELVKWAGVLLVMPVAYVWKRATGAVQRNELAAVIDAIGKRHDERAEQDRQQFTQISERLSRVAEATARIEGYMQGEQNRKT